MKATFVKKVHESADIYSFVFQPEESLDYIAGQFIELSLDLERDTNDIPRRWFTLSSSPTEGHIMISTRIRRDTTDYKRRLMQLKPGDETTTSQAMGDFVLPTSSALPLIFVAAGIGITPFRSIIKWLIDNNEQRDIWFLRIVGDNQSIVFEQEFSEYRFQHNEVIISKNVDIKELAQKIISNIPSKETLIYTAGPEPMVELLKHDLLLNNIPENTIVTDFFPGYTQL